MVGTATRRHGAHPAPGSNPVPGSGAAATGQARHRPGTQPQRRPALIHDLDADHQARSPHVAQAGMVGLNCPQMAGQPRAHGGGMLVQAVGADPVQGGWSRSWAHLPHREYGIGHGRSGRIAQGAAQAERTHVGPHPLDVGEAVLLGAADTDRAPTGRNRLMVGPDRVLFLVIHHDVKSRVRAVPVHAEAPSGQGTEEVIVFGECAFGRSCHAFLHNEIDSHLQVDL